MLCFEGEALFKKYIIIVRQTRVKAETHTKSVCGHCFFAVYECPHTMRPEFKTETDHANMLLGV